MNDITAVHKEISRAATLTTVLGIITGITWLLVALTSLNILTGWIIHNVLATIVWIQLIIIDRKFKLNPLVWAFHVFALTAGVLAYTLPLTGIPTPTTSLIAGIGGGGFLIITALIAKQQTKKMLTPRGNPLSKPKIASEKL